MCQDIHWKQSFYADVELIKLREPLAEFLGAVNPGEEFSYTYEDAVKLAGHSCPSVAGAYKLTQKALVALYGQDIPVRGQVSVKVLGAIEDGANGPMSQVIGLITGAAGQAGFAGLGLRFVRKDKLIFDQENSEPNSFIFTRDDTGKSVKITYNLRLVPPEPGLPELLTKCVVETADQKQKEEFQRLWQARVKAVLLEEISGLFTLQKIN